MTRPRNRDERPLHPGAWWAWALALGAAATRTTNPLVLALLMSAAGFTVASRHLPAGVRTFGFFLRLGVFVVLMRIVFEVVFGAERAGDVVVTLPTVPLPHWAAGLHLGGNVTVQALLTALYGGLQLAALIVCIGSANALASPRRLLRAMPGALYEAGVAITVATSFAPQLASAVVRVRRARRLRGRTTTGPRSWIGVALPVLEDALERSIDLAAAMDSKGFGRRGSVPAGRRRLVAGSVVGGLLAIAVAVYGLLDTSSPAVIGLPLLVAGTLVAGAAILFGGRGVHRTRYRPDSWLGTEWVVLGSGLAALIGVLLAGRWQPGALHTTTYPLAAPTLPWPAMVGIALATAPAWIGQPRRHAPPTPETLVVDVAVDVPIGVGR